MTGPASRNEPAERETFRIRGVDNRGNNRLGQHVLSRAELAAQVKRWHRNGWRSLTVCTADGGEVASIGPHPDTGKRAWWSEA